MTNYKLELRIQFDGSKSDIEEILENVSADIGFTIKKQVIAEVRPRGRQSAFTKKIKFFLDRRTKPFSAKTFGDYVGLGASAAWRRLDRLVAQGQLYKIRNEDGTVLYSTQVIVSDRSDNPVVGE